VAALVECAATLFFRNIMKNHWLERKRHGGDDLYVILCNARFQLKKGCSYVSRVDGDTFNMDVYDMGVQVESWGGLTNDRTSRFYYKTFLNTHSRFVTIKED